MLVPWSDHLCVRRHCREWSVTVVVCLRARKRVNPIIVTWLQLWMQLLILTWFDVRSAPLSGESRKQQTRLLRLPHITHLRGRVITITQFLLDLWNACLVFVIPGRGVQQKTTRYFITLNETWKNSCTRDKLLNYLQATIAYVLHARVGNYVKSGVNYK